MCPAPSESFAACRAILARVSRTFALTIPTLREPLRTQVEIAYLLCRIADTIEDRRDLATSHRDALFKALQKLADDPAKGEALVSLWPPGDANGDLLFQRAPDVGRCFASLPAPVRQDVRRCLDEMIEGMRTFASRGTPPMREPCEDLDALERYCHHVAGTVGILITRLFARELPPAWLSDRRLETGRRFGLGLQLTNVLKDRSADRERGVSYVPPEFQNEGPHISEVGMRTIAGRALEHLAAGQDYVLSVPPEREDMRLFCEWAILLALLTLERVALRVDPPKATRTEVASIESRTRKAIRDDAALCALFAEGTGRLESALARPADPASSSRRRS